MMMQTTSALWCMACLRDHRRAHFCCRRKRAGRRHRCARCHRARCDCRRSEPDRFDRRLGDGNSLRARTGQAHRRNRHHQPLSGDRAEGKTECRLSAAIVAGGGARSVADAGARRRRRRAEGGRERDRGGVRSVRACAGPVHRRGHCREDQAHCNRDRPGQAGRMPCEERGSRSRGDGEDARGGHETGARRLHPVVPERARDGRRQEHRRRRHHPARGRGQCHGRVRRLQDRQRRSVDRGAARQHPGDGALQFQTDRRTKCSRTRRSAPAPPPRRNPSHRWTDFISWALVRAPPRPRAIWRIRSIRRWKPRHCRRNATPSETCRS